MSLYKTHIFFFQILFPLLISRLPRFIIKNIYRKREEYLIEDINKLNENNTNKEREIE